MCCPTAGVPADLGAVSVLFRAGVRDCGGWVAGGEGVSEGFVEVLFADGFFVARVNRAVFGVARGGFVDGGFGCHAHRTGDAWGSVASCRSESRSRTPVS